jgi:DNA-binding transcriptional LysR family regulator
MHIVETDLNLLRTFEAIYATGSVSRAAQRLGLSQPTVSHALRRLRMLHRDPLFVRTRHGVAPTVRADRLAAAVARALHILDGALRDGERYEPATSTRTFRLHMSDIGETVFLPRLMSALAREAPGVTLEVHQVDPPDIGAALEDGRLDLALGSLPDLAGGERTFLLHERYVVAMRERHPLASLRFGRSALARLDYVLVRSHPATAEALRQRGLASRIRLSIPHFLVLPRILAETDLAVVMPSRLYDAFAQMGAYAVWRPRAGLPAFDVSVHWNWRFTGDPGNRWLRERIVALFGEK